MVSLGSLRAMAGDSTHAGRLWRSAAVASVAAVVAYALLPVDRPVIRDLILVPVADVAAIAAVLFGVYVYRPRAPLAWLLIAGGLTSFAIANTIYGTHLVRGISPFPSSADIFYLAAYPLFALGLHVAGRARLPEGERGTFVDAAILTAIASLFALLLIANKYVEDSDLPLLTAIFASAYPLADLLLFAVAIKFILTVSWRPPALRLLVLSLALNLAGDLLYSAGELFTSPGDHAAADTLLLAGHLTMGLAGLHPSMTELTAEPPEVIAPLASVQRVVALYLLSLVPAVVLAIQGLISDTDYIWITITVMTVVTLLVVVRVVDIVQQRRQAAVRESTLSRLGAELLVADGRDELVAAAERAASQVVTDGEAHVVEVGAPVDESRPLFRAPIEQGGVVVAYVVADEQLTALRGTRDALHSVAHSVSLAFERDALLAAQRADAESLAEQNAQLRELDRMKDQLVSSVSHELRTPLTSIGGYTEMLLGGEFGELNEDQLEFVETVDRNTRRLNRLIDDILFVARVDAGRLSLEQGWVDLAELAAASVTAARPRAQKGEVILELSAAEDLEPVWADPTRITQMLDNLVSNAVKFTPPGGKVRVGLTRTEDRVLVEVADTGMGIPADEVDRLFERFFRTSTVGEVAGTGLGLSIVKSIVEVHDGSIAVTSSEGVGTTFRVELPVRSRSETPRHETEVAE